MAATLTRGHHRMLRIFFYWLARWRDAKALANGRYPQRVARRHAHRSLARLLRRGGL